MITLSAQKLYKTLSLPSGEVQALLGFSADFQERKRYAITGPSGCGKSTLLYLLGLLDNPTSGQIVLHGVSTQEMSPNERTHMRNKNLGFIFQFHFLLPELTVTENIILPALKLGIIEEEAIARANVLMRDIGLAEKSSRFAWQLSGGEQQRVAIARALINEPELLLADEPTGNLDSHTGEGIIELLKNLRAENKTTLIIATHDARVAAHAERVVELVDGQIKSSSASSS